MVKNDAASAEVIPLATGRVRRSRRVSSAPAGTPLPAMIDSFELWLMSKNYSENTRLAYLGAARMFTEFLVAQALPCDTEGVKPEHVRLFLVAQQKRASALTVSHYHQRLQAWFTWMEGEGERTESTCPVLMADKPTFPTKVKIPLTEEELARLLATCKGNSFLDRRDTAILRVLMDNGVRVSGLTGLHLDHVDLRGKTLKIILKGGDEHLAPIGARTVAALDRYLRVRARHPLAELPYLWLAERGPNPTVGLTRSGVQYLLEQRGKQAGVANVHPHRFRATATHHLLAAGGGESDVQRIMGWKTQSMVQHYSAGLAHERARAAHAGLSLSDRL
ncbi:tyrosine-type recombinase/integrase [Streptosporangium jomthongense]|uniref:Tyrosine-type recombinase/integrase n=1 Tax=Streptosporangium jomthongense TaxID=1193683 RepID=A0ABV8EX73_9ACTN